MLARKRIMMLKKGSPMAGADGEQQRETQRRKKEGWTTPKPETEASEPA
jgi:hypothetical protein